MKIGIIGAGQIGGTLVRRLRELGHEVNVSNSRSPETLAELANEPARRQCGPRTPRPMLISLS